jgi:hypothetical protein
MPRDSTLRCAYLDCKKTTDKKSFGHVNKLSDHHCVSYSAWLKPQHDGVVCNSHYNMLRRLLERQEQAPSDAAAGVQQLLAAHHAVDSESSSSVQPSLLSSEAQHVDQIQIVRTSSLPLPAPSRPPTATSLRRSASTPLLRANRVGCDSRKRRGIAFACAMSGLTWTMWNRLEANVNTCSMYETTWYRLTKKVWEAIEDVKNDREAAYAQQLLDANELIDVVADGAWSHPGFAAGQHDWVLMNAADKKIIFTIPLHRSRERRGKVVHQGNYDDGSSKGMEGFALDIAIERLQASGLIHLIRGWVGDQDSSVLKQLRECPAAQRWEVHLDPGHAKKNLQKTLMNLFGAKQEFDGLAKRIATFVMRLTKRAEKEHAGNRAKMREQFLLWLDCVVPHYTQSCDLDCPHHQSDAADGKNALQDSPGSADAKTYLRADRHAAQINVLQSLINCMKQTTRYFIHGYNTCNAERYHRERLRLTPKLLEFWATWAPRCALNQLLHNNGYAETHRLVLAKLKERSGWTLDIVHGNQFVEAMDRIRARHSARKSKPEYNRRQDQLARERGLRRAQHDAASQRQGHDYQHTPPLFSQEEKNGKRRRRTSEEVKAGKEKEEAEKRRLQGLFDAGDTTFTTLGTVNVNVCPKERKAKKAKKTGADGQENRYDEPPVAVQEATSPAAAAVIATPVAPASAPQAVTVARAVMFR